MRIQRWIRIDSAFSSIYAAETDPGVGFDKAIGLVMLAFFISSLEQSCVRLDFFFYLFLSIYFSVIMIRNDDQYEQNDSLIFSGRFVFSISTIFFQRSTTYFRRVH